MFYLAIPNIAFPNSNKGLRPFVYSVNKNLNIVLKAIAENDLTKLCSLGYIQTSKREYKFLSNDVKLTIYLKENLDFIYLEIELKNQSIRIARNYAGDSNSYFVISISKSTDNPLINETYNFSFNDNHDLVKSYDVINQCNISETEVQEKHLLTILDI